MRPILGVLLALAPALPARAQVRAAAPASGAHVVGVVPALAPALSALGAPSIVAAPSALSAVLPAAGVPAVSLPALPVPAVAPVAAPALAAAPAALTPTEKGPVVPTPAPPIALHAPASIDRDGKLVVRSLQDLHVLFRAGDGAAAFDGKLPAWADPASAGPRAVEGMNGVSARAVSGAASAESLPEFQPHEIETIRKIQARASDLRVLAREAGKTPDLLVEGVVTELKSVHDGKIARQLEHANAQLVSHAKRHGLGAGAVVLDVIGAPLTVARVEAGIAEAIAAAPAVGFDRVYVFHGEDLKVYARAADGAFRLAPGALPFRRAAPSVPAPSAAPAGAAAFVPPALANALLPDADAVLREINEPSRLLRERGIEATVTMYGSARILSPETAQAAYDAALAEVGRRPKGKEARARLAAAREAVRMSKYYRIARELGALVAAEGGGKVAVVTGGGPGIMEAGNRGAFEAGGPSVGYNIKLPHEQDPNPYATPGLSFDFEHFSTRKMALRHGSMGLVYFPGGFGTMDELFEVLTLMQTGKMPRVPIVLMGERAYWDKVLDFDEFDHMGLISHKDLSLFVYAETARQAWDAIRSAHAARP